MKCLYLRLQFQLLYFMCMKFASTRRSPLDHRAALKYIGARVSDVSVMEMLVASGACHVDIWIQFETHGTA